jgi:hypothetical protein
MPKTSIDMDEPDSPDGIKINADKYLKQDADHKEDPQATLEHNTVVSGCDVASV